MTLSRHARQRGFSLMEMTVVLAVSMVVIAIAYGLIDDALKTTLFIESHNDLAVISQRAVNTIQRDVFQAQTVFGGDTAGQAYRTALVLQSTPITGTVLPNIDPLGSFGPDGTTPTIAAARETGNSLLIVRQLPPLTIDNFDHDDNAATPAITFLADQYQFQFYYQVADSGINFSGTGSVYDLVQATSNVYADYFQLASGNLSTAQRKYLCTQIKAKGVNLLWSPGSPVASAIYDTSDCTDGSFASDTPNAASIAIISTRSLMTGLKGGRISGRMIYTLAKHQTNNKAWPQTEHALPRYAQWSSATPQFPGGFEVKVIGPTGLRQTLVRILLLSHYGTNKYDSQEAVAITSSRY